MGRKKGHPKTKARTRKDAGADSARGRAMPAKEPSGRSLNQVGFIVAIVGLVALFALVVFLGPGDAPPPDAAPIRLLDPGDDAPDRPSSLEAWQSQPIQEIPVTARDFARGPEDAAVEIVEFSDFECPFCRVATRSLRQVLDAYPSDVRLVYKNFPLDLNCNEDMTQQLHAFACRAAVVARCAGEKDPEDFWRFHDAVFERENLSDELLDSVAASLGVTGEEFDRCLAGTEAISDVRADVDVALGLKLTATPTLFVNGRYAASYRLEDLSEIIDHILASN